MKDARSKRRTVARRDGWKCWLCGRRVREPGAGDSRQADDIATLDHVVPLSKGGSNHNKNLRIACPPCNKSRGAPDVEPVSPVCVRRPA